jgi:hypothetical protein
MMRSIVGVKRSSSHIGSGDSWTIDIAVLGNPRTRHLVVVENGAHELLVCEPVPTADISGVSAMVERTFKKLDAPAEIVTDAALDFLSENTFRSLLASFGVRHVVAPFTDRLSNDAALRLCRNGKGFQNQ